MRCRTFVLSTLLALSAGLAPLAAEDALTLEQARTLTLGRSTALQSALVSVDAALIDEKLQDFTLLPSISASASASADVPAATMQDAVQASIGLSVRQTIFDGTASILAAIDSLSTSIARAEARAAYLEVLEAADAAYYIAAAAAAAAEAAQSDLVNARDLLALAKAKLEAGMISPVAYLEQEAAVASRQTSLVQAQGRLSAALRTLVSLTGRSLPLPIAGIDTARYDALAERFADLSEAQTASAAERIVEAASEDGAALVRAQLANQKAVQSVSLAKAGYLPTVSAGWSSSVGFAATGTEVKSSISLSASIPLDAWKTKAAADATSAAATKASLALQEAERTTSLQVQATVDDAIAAARAVASSKMALEYAEGYYESILEQYRLSAASASDLSGAALLVGTSRSSLISARAQFLEDLTSLRTLAGMDNEDSLLQLVLL
jgi:outer membrane protein